MFGRFGGGSEIICLCWEVGYCAIFLLVSLILHPPLLIIVAQSLTLFFVIGRPKWVECCSLWHKPELRFLDLIKGSFEFTQSTARNEVFKGINQVQLNKQWNKTNKHTWIQIYLFWLKIVNATEKLYAFNVVFLTKKQRLSILLQVIKDIL